MYIEPHKTTPLNIKSKIVDINDALDLMVARLNYTPVTTVLYHEKLDTNGQLPERRPPFMVKMQCEFMSPTLTLEIPVEGNKTVRWMDIMIGIRYETAIANALWNSPA